MFPKLFWLKFNVARVILSNLYSLAFTMSGDEGETIKIVDTKEVVFPHLRSTIAIPSKPFTVDETETFLKLQPRNYVQVARLIISRCPKEMRKEILKNRKFWQSKTSKGKLFLDKLRSMKAKAIKTKFDVKGVRFMSRQKQQRPKQIMANSISVPLPTVGDHVGVPVVMQVASTTRLNGKIPLSIKLEPASLDHIAIMAREFFGDLSSDGNSDVDDEADNNSNDTNKSDADAQDCDEHASLLADVPDVDNIDHVTDNTIESSPSQCDQPMNSVSPILRAFMRGAKSK